MRATILALVLLAACGDDGAVPDDAGVTDDAPSDARVDAGDPYPWQIPPGFPTPLVPVDNPMTVDKVELGRRLFYDKRMSGNQTFSCASCHHQESAFTDDMATAVGSTGQIHPRNSMSLTNIAYLGRFTWANPVLDQLETQAATPIFGTEPVELGLRNMDDAFLARVRAEPLYPPLFASAFPGDSSPISMMNVVRAISAFERTLLSGSSPYDKFLRGDTTAISESAVRGRNLFNSEKCECFHCHTGFNFQDVTKYEGKPTTEARFHNTGLYNLGGTGAYTVPNRGIYEITLQPADMGKFRAPTLRNIAVTAPYFHDGSAATLDDVLDHYAAAGRTITSGPNAGVGSANPFKDSLIIGFTLSQQERDDLKAFLHSLTDDEFLHDPRFSDPWQ